MFVEDNIYYKSMNDFKAHNGVCFFFDRYISSLSQIYFMVFFTLSSSVFFFNIIFYILVDIFWRQALLLLNRILPSWFHFNVQLEFFFIIWLLLYILGLFIILFASLEFFYVVVIMIFEIFNGFYLRTANDRRVGVLYTRKEIRKS